MGTEEKADYGQALERRECLEYFRRHPVFDKILRGFREKYASYGSFSGTVTVRNPSKEELEDLEGFFQKSFHGQKSISISAARFCKALKDSKFGSVEPKEILELYFREEMTGKKEQRKLEEQKRMQERQELLAEMKAQCAGTWAAQWMEEQGAYSYVMKQYRESGKGTEEIRRLLLLGIRILNGLPYRQNQTEYLAVYAAMMTGNPHAFDDGTRDGQFLHLLVEWDVRHRGITVESSVLFPVLRRQKMYYSVGILRDDISNYVMVCGIRAWKRVRKSCDGLNRACAGTENIHAGMEGFLAEREPVQVPLSVIAKWECVDCPDKSIYVVENPSVFAMLCAKWKGTKACMCMNGQPRLSSILLLDLLAEAGVTLYYAGDFDPEGLLIAQKVKWYYKGKSVYWHMSAAEYEKSRSREMIPEKRMRMLERIEDVELTGLADAIKRSGMAGYQENVWEVYLELE